MSKESLKITFQNWEYQILTKDDTFAFIIHPNPKKEKPKSLFKYQSVSNYSIENLVQNRFYIPHSEDFNDLFDSSFHRVNKNTISKEIAKNTLVNYSEFEKHWNQNESDLKNFVISKNHLKTYSTLGLLCMTPNSQNDLMWAYYGNNEGFCLEFDYTKFQENFTGPFPVNYLDDYKTLDIQQLRELTLLVLATTKKIDWKHEDEYRFIVYSSKGKYKISEPYNSTLNYPERFESYPKESLLSITLGFNFNKNENFTPISEGQNGIEYHLKFRQKNNAKLKQDLFDKIIEDKIPCFGITHELPTLQLKKEKLEIKKISENNYHVITTHIF